MFVFNWIIDVRKDGSYGRNIHGIVDLLTLDTRGEETFEMEKNRWGNSLKLQCRLT